MNDVGISSINTHSPASQDTSTQTRVSPVLKNFPNKQPLDSYTLNTPSTGTLQTLKAWPVEYYENGQRSSAYLAHPTVIDGIPCASKGSSGHPVQVCFYRNGKVKDAYLADNWTDPQTGATFVKSSLIRFYPDGRVLAGVVINSPLSWTDNNSEMTFYNTGEVASAKIGNQDTRFQNQLYQRNTEITRWPNGIVKSGLLAESTELNGVKYRAGTWFGFNAEGSDLVFQWNNQPTYPRW